MKELGSLVRVEGLGGQGDLVQAAADLGGGELQGGFGQAGGRLSLGQQIAIGFVAGMNFFAPDLFFEPVLVTAFMPMGEVGVVEGGALLVEFFDDGRVGGAVVEHLVDEVALGFGEPGDFAVAAAVGAEGIRGGLGCRVHF